MPDRDDPCLNYNFLLEIEGFASIQFAEVSGIALETDVVTYRGGGMRRASLMPGRTKAGEITLKRGITQSRDLWEWYETVINAAVERKSCALTILGTAFEAQVRYQFIDAWPRKYVGPILHAQGNDVAIEELVLVCEEIRLAD